jgi:hypothetical protein
MSQQKVIAVYDTTAHAEAAVKTLKSAGYSADDISVKLNQDDAPKVESGELGLWHRLFGRNIELHGAAAYAHTVSRGRAVVTVHVPEWEVRKVIEVLDTY